MSDLGAIHNHHEKKNEGRGEEEQKKISRWHSYWANYKHYIDKRPTDHETFYIGLDRKGRPKYKKYSKLSLGMLTNKNRFRILLVQLINLWVFDALVLILIVFNSLLLGYKDYLDPEDMTSRN